MIILFIKNISLGVKGCQKVEIMAFEGTKESFFACFEIMSSKSKQNLFNFGIEKSGNEVILDLKITRINREFKETINSVVEAIRSFYTNEYGSELTFTVKKNYVLGEIAKTFLRL